MRRRGRRRPRPSLRHYRGLLAERIAQRRAVLHSLEGLNVDDEGSEATLRAAFDFFDTDGSGHLSRAEIRRLVHAMHPAVSGRTLSRALDAGGKMGEGEQVTFEQFLNKLDEWNQHLSEHIDELVATARRRASHPAAALGRRGRRPPPAAARRPNSTR